jgi:hypothetical protein
VPDVSRVAVGAVEQPAVEHDATAHAGRHDHGDEVARARGRALPTLADGQRLGVVVDERGQTGARLQPGAQREAAPGPDVERRDRLPAQRHRPATTHAADHHGAARGRSPDGLDQRDQRVEDHLGVGGRRSRRGRRPQQLAVRGDEGGRELGAADVDRERHVHPPTVRPDPAPPLHLGRIEREAKR